jgi:trimethylamine corrinoid protein
MLTGEEILDQLRQAIVDYDADGAANWARAALAEGVDAGEALDVMTATVREIGDAFGSGDLFLPDLVMAGEAMKCGSSVLEEAIKRTGSARGSKAFVIGTVAGDIHDIGKSLVATMFVGAGYRVVDLGIDVPCEAFIQAVNDHQPDLLGLSALLSATALEQGRVIQALEDAGLRGKVKVMVGGGAINEEFAERIGADGYAANAAEAVVVAQALLFRG